MYDGKICSHCGKPNNAPSKYQSRYGGMREDHSAICNGILTWRTDPFAEEINGDSSLYLMCDGAEYESAMDI